MRTFIAVFLLLFLASPVGAQIVTTNGKLQISSSGGGTPFVAPTTGQYVQATTGAMSLYVRADGNDANTCTANTPTGACLTIQAAINKIPKFLSHAVTVSVGAGTFAGFTVSGFTANTGGSLQVVGTLGPTTLHAGGTTSGTATGGTKNSCIDSSQNWGGGDLMNKYVLIGGEYRIIVGGNDDTSFSFFGDIGASCSGQAYSLLEHKTILSANGSIGFGNIEFAANIQRSYASFKFQDLRGVSPDASCLWAGYSCGLHLTRIQAQQTGSYGMFLQELTGQIYVDNISAIQSNADGGIFFVNGGARTPTARGKRIYSIMNAGIGVYLGSVPFSVFDGIYVEQNDSHGLAVWYSNGLELHNLHCQQNGGNGMDILGTPNIDADDEASYFGYNSGYGIQLDRDEYRSSMTLGAGTVVEGNSPDGIYVGSGSTLFLTGPVTGTYNNEYGVRVRSNAFVQTTNGVTVTGDLGDTTVNDGNVILHWATDFSTNRDTVTNSQNGAKIVQVDSL